MATKRKDLSEVAASIAAHMDKHDGKEMKLERVKIRRSGNIAIVEVHDPPDNEARQEVATNGNAPS